MTDMHPNQFLLDEALAVKESYGLTPRQLAEQRAELHKAIMQIAERPKVVNDSLTFEDALEEINSMIDLARSVSGVDAKDWL